MENREEFPGRDSGAGRTGTPLFRASSITKIYHQGTQTEVRALDGVDLELFDGELAVLLGASGSGKSTLLNILGGLDVPTGGRLFYREDELTGADEDLLTAFRRDSVGFVFQFYNLIPSLTARENVALVTEIAPDPMPGGSSSGSPSPGPSRSAPRSSCATNPPGPSTSRPASPSSRRWKR
jgi:putative ABC transport system ATP-binding protein